MVLDKFQLLFKNNLIFPLLTRSNPASKNSINNIKISKNHNVNFVVRHDYRVYKATD